MLAKRTVKNQITLPKTVIARFDVSTDGETIVLRPLQIDGADEVRTRLEQLGVEEQDVSDALSWSRQAS